MHQNICAALLEKITFTCAINPRSKEHEHRSDLTEFRPSPALSEDLQLIMGPPWSKSMSGAIVKKAIKGTLSPIGLGNCSSDMMTLNQALYSAASPTNYMIIQLTRKNHNNKKEEDQ